VLRIVKHISGLKGIYYKANCWRWNQL